VKETINNRQCDRYKYE